MTEKSLEQKVKELIDSKADVMNKNATSYLIEISEYIKQLNLYIDGSLPLADTEIESKLDYLVGYYTITLKHPIDAL